MYRSAEARNIRRADHLVRGSYRIQKKLTSVCVCPAPVLYFSIAFDFIYCSLSPHTQKRSLYTFF